MKSLGVSAIAALLTVFLLTPTIVPPVCAGQTQSDSEALADYFRSVRIEITAKRDSALKTLLDLTDEEAEAFWPLQKAYDKELKKLDKKDLAMIREFGAVYDKLTPEISAKLGGEFFDLEREVLALQQKYFELMADQISPVIAVQFVQLQRRFETQALLKRMTYAPLAEK